MLNVLLRLLWYTARAGEASPAFNASMNDVTSDAGNLTLDSVGNDIRAIKTLCISSGDIFRKIDGRPNL